MKPIKFGTDGWRAIIADGYTFENLTRVAVATAQWLRKQGQPDLQVVIGHDTRFMGRQFAEHVASVLAGQGLRVLFAQTAVTTPTVSWATLHYGAQAGIVITASHNPPEYNGYKLKASFGGPASPEMVAEVEAELDHLPAAMPEILPFEKGCASGQIEVRDIGRAYLGMMREKLDLGAIQASGVKVAHDAMYGVGQGLVAALLGQERVVELHASFNPGFDGQPPEPIERNLGELAEAVVREGCAVGLANDGDADRIGMYDENGRFVSSHEILALLVKYLHTIRGLSGGIVKTFSTTHLLNKMGQAYGLPVETLPIGFKYIATKMVEGDVLVGGEESGGIAVKGHIPERDGIYIGLLVVEMMVKRGKKLSELVAELYDEFGPHATYRIDLHTTEERKARALDRLETEKGLRQIAGQDVVELDTLDGYKHLLKEGWLLVRASGTEPVLRVYSEAPTEKEAQALVEDAIAQLGV